MTETAAREMPKYKCHKEVHALKILSLGMIGDSPSIIPADAGYEPFPVTAGWIEKHGPEVGGYYVVYADGYTSYSPAKAFEDGYTKL